MMAVYVNPNQENKKKITAFQQQSSVAPPKNSRSYQKFPKGIMTSYERITPPYCKSPRDFRGSKALLHARTTRS